jgi:lipoprotein-anchoring transpeptidase ErfK/SrfK
MVVFNQFRRDFRPRVVFALGVRRDADGQPAWYRISVPGRPNGRAGWIPAESVTLEPIRKEIRIDLSRRQLEVRRGRRLELRTRVAVGAPGMTTPVGYFYVAAKIPRPRYPVLGVFAFETSAYSSLSDWPGGGIVGIHGTPMPWLLGQAVSHGCLRVANPVILRMSRLVPLGTPIRVVR